MAGIERMVNAREKWARELSRGHMLNICAMLLDFVLKNFKPGMVTVRFEYFRIGHLYLQNMRVICIYKRSY